MPVAMGMDSENSKYTLEKGEYHFRVIEKMVTKNDYVFTTRDTESTGGHPQIALVLQVGDASGTITMLESLTFSKKAMYRISQFLRASGVYAGTGVKFNLNAKMCIGLSGRCTVFNEKPEDSKYERTKLDEWVDAKDQNPDDLPGLVLTESQIAMEAQEPDHSDDIPF